MTTPSRPAGTSDPLPAALAAHRAGRLADAEAGFRAALAAAPGHPVALHGLGLVCHQAGRHAEAVGLLRQAVAGAPASAEFRSNLAAVLGRLGRHADAAAELRHAVRLKPGYAEAWCNLGAALERSGRPAEAAEAYGRAVGLTDKVPADGAVSPTAVLRTAVRAHVALGNLLRRAGRSGEAEAAHRRAVALDPASSAAWAELATTLGGQGRLAEVIAARRRVAELRPASPAAASAALATLHYADESTPGELLAAALAWGEKFGRGGVGVWRGGDVGDVLAPRGGATAPLRSRLVHAPDVPAGVHSERRRDAAAGGLSRLRVGFLSSNFTAHPEGRFLRPVLANLDRLAAETFCYSATARPDPLTGTLRGLCDRWRDVTKLPDDAAADAIRADRLDVLVELTGHFGNHRLGILARRPVARQAALFGSPGTYGMPGAVGWRFTDRVADPPDVAAGDPADGVGAYGPSDRRAGGAYTAERLVGLGPMAWVYDPPAEARAVGPPPAGRDRPVTFACVNNPLKVTPAAVAAWARILDAVPGSRLMILGESRRAPGAGRREPGGSAAGPGGAAMKRGGTVLYSEPCPRMSEGADTVLSTVPCHPEAAAAYLHAEFARHGVAGGRVGLVARQPRARYFEWVHAADVALDPFPYNGGVTTCDTLWMGVPVVTRAGGTYWSRQGALLLGHAGLPELVAADWDGYVAAAVALANDRDRLADVRAGLRARLAASPACDAAGYARRLVDGLRAIVEA